MKSFIAALRSLVLPFGAISGARIILDGVNGRIQIYNAANVLIANLDSNGLVIANTVTVNEHGIDVLDLTGTLEFLVNRTAGFFARRNPDDGTHIQIYDTTISLQSASPTPNGNTLGAGSIRNGMDTAGVVETPWIDVNSQTINGNGQSHITLYGESSTGADSLIRLTADETIVSARLINAGTAMDYASSQLFNTTFAVTAGATRVNTGFINYPIAFPVGKTLFGIANIINGASTADQWTARWVPQDNTRFALLLFCPGGAPANVSLGINVHVFVL